jgi:hypothetical protein
MDRPTPHVAAGSLHDWIVQGPNRRAALPKHEIMGDLIRTMSDAHRQGNFHGNLNAASIRFKENAARGFAIQPPPPRDAQTKIAGFSFAGMERPDPQTQNLYVPPDASPDPASADVFAIGVIWYQLLVDRLERPPYDFAHILRAAGHDSHTVAMISRCLASPGRRFANANELEKEFTGAAPPIWPPVPKGCVDVSQIVREYLTVASS